MYVCVQFIVLNIDINPNIVSFSNGNAWVFISSFSLILIKLKKHTCVYCDNYNTQVKEAIRTTSVFEETC